MKKTNVLVEVPEDIYDTVVIPHKKMRSFSRLISTLLYGYANDEYVRAYAEGTLEESARESVDALDEVIEGMQSSLSNMGLFTSELKNTTNAGTKAFASRSFRQLMQSQQVVEEQPPKDSEEVGRLKETVDELKIQNAEIMGMLKNLLSSGASTVSTTSTVAEQPKPAVQKKVQESNPIHTPTYVPEVKSEPISLVEMDDDSEETVSAEDALSSLLMGNVASF